MYKEIEQMVVYVQMYGDIRSAGAAYDLMTDIISS